MTKILFEKYRIHYREEKYQKYASLMDFYHKKIKNLEHQLEEKNKVIDEAIYYINNHNELEKELGGTIKFSVVKLMKILERNKNEQKRN